MSAGSETIGSHGGQETPYEAIKVEQNSKGVNVSVRVVRAPHETEPEWIERLGRVYRAVQQQVNR